MPSASTNALILSNAFYVNAPEDTKKREGSNLENLVDLQPSIALISRFLVRKHRRPFRASRMRRALRGTYRIHGLPITVVMIDLAHP